MPASTNKINPKATVEKQSRPPTAPEMPVAL